MVILVLDNGTKISKDDKSLLNDIKSKKSIIFVNKTDLNTKIKLPKLEQKIVFGNTTNEDGLDLLLKSITEMFNLEQISQKDPTYISNVRQQNLVIESLNLINFSLENIKFDYTIDFLASDIKKAWDLLGEIIGETYNDELLDELFSNFCLGK